MNREQIFGLVRTLLAAGGGMLVAKGYLDNETLNQVVSALLVLGAAGWSFVEKQKAKG